MERIRALRSLPAMPQAVSRLVALLADEDHDAAEIGQVLASDRALSLCVLRAANSAALGGLWKVKTVPEAVARLGASRLTRLVLSQMGEHVIAQGGRGYGLEAETAWEGALAGGIAAELVARGAGVDPSIAFTCGLLRDCGKLAMDALFGAAEVRRATTGAAPERCQLDVEREAFGCDHAEAGAVLVRTWSLDGEIEAAVRWHHEPSRGDSRLIDTVHAADVIAAQLGYGVGLDGLAYGLDEAALARVRVDGDRLVEIMAESTERTRDLVAEMRALEQA